MTPPVTPPNSPAPTAPAANPGPWWLRAARTLLRFRYIKFGTVGASGTVVNLIVLRTCQEWLLHDALPEGPRLYLSLAIAIFVATINNFFWNRLWTWADRMDAPVGGTASQGPGLLGQFGRYCVASWLGTALQYGLTIWLSQHMHYLVGNVIAIVVASVSNYLANDFWTFRKRTGTPPAPR